MIPVYCRIADTRSRRIAEEIDLEGFGSGATFIQGSANTKAVREQLIGTRSPRSMIGNYTPEEVRASDARRGCWPSQEQLKPVLPFIELPQKKRTGIPKVSVPSSQGGGP